MTQPNRLFLSRVRMSRRLQSECGAPTTYLIARWQTMVFHRIEAKRNFSCIWWRLAPWQIDGWCERGMCRCQARSSQWRGTSAVTWGNRHLSLMRFPGGVKPQWQLFTQSVSCGMRAGCRGGSSDASSSVVWSTRHFLALRPSARRRHSIKLSRRW